LLDVVRERAPRPWLCPLTRALAAPRGPLERILLGHTGEVQAVAVTPDGARIVSAGFDTVRIWDLASGSEIARWRADPGIRIEPCCTVPTDSSRFVYGDSAGCGHVLQLLE
jgi:WD40 repeat protein